jgi:hypothetical protein
VCQGAYRGLADTRTPLVATLASNGLNVVLGYALVFGAGLGVRCACGCARGSEGAGAHAQVVQQRASEHARRQAVGCDVCCLVPCTHRRGAAIATVVSQVNW